MRITFVLLLVSLLVLLGGCATVGPSTYGQNEQMQAALTWSGVVQSVRPVTISGDPGAASVASGYGALLGGVAFSSLGGGTGKALAALLGIGVGSAAARGIANHAEGHTGYQITVLVQQPQGQQLFTVIQPRDAWTPSNGEKVYLIETRQNWQSRFRVEPAS